MDKKCQQIENEKNHGQILVAMAKVVFNMIALVFKRIKAFVFNFPACSAAFDQLGHIIFVDDNISHPAVAVSGFSFIDKLVVKKIDLIGIFGAVCLSSVNHSNKIL